MLRVLSEQREGDNVVSEYVDPWKCPNWPVWKDDQRRIDAIFDNGAIVLDGTLSVDDFGFDGEDEYPIFVVFDSNGNKFSFCDVAKYRFI